MAGITILFRSFRDPIPIGSNNVGMWYSHNSNDCETIVMLIILSLCAVCRRQDSFPSSKRSSQFLKYFGHGSLHIPSQGILQSSISAASPTLSKMQLLSTGLSLLLPYPQTRS